MNPAAFRFTRRLLSLTIDELVSGPLSPPPPPVFLSSSFTSWLLFQLETSRGGSPTQCCSLHQYKLCIIKHCMRSPAEARYETSERCAVQCFAVRVQWGVAGHNPTSRRPVISITSDKPQAFIVIYISLPVAQGVSSLSDTINVFSEPE